MEVEVGEDGASAGRGEGGADAPAAHARPSEHAAAPARPASASAITAMVLSLGGDQAQGTGSSVSVQDMARRVREWVIHKPPSAKHSA